MRRLSFLVLLSLPLVSLCQVQSVSDTIRMKEIVVSAGLLSEVADAFKQVRIDTLSVNEMRHGSISDIITESGYIYIKSYGPGGIATPSFRGTGASHTQLSWNGISVNSPMLGQADLSLIPGGFIDEIKIYTGLASLAITSGGLGGTIDFVNGPDWKSNELLETGIAAASFGRFSTYGRLFLGGDRFRSVTRAFFQSGDNDFKYIDNVNGPSPEYKYRLNAEYSKKGLMQEFYLRNDKSVSSARIWLQEAERNLPASILMPQVIPSENQTDIFLRTIINHRRFYRKSNIDLTVALFSDRLDYVNQQASVNSKNHSITLNSKAAFEKEFTKNTHLEILLTNEYSRVNSVNYSDIKSRSVSGLSAAARKSFGENIGMVLLVRQMIMSGRILLPDISAGADIRIIRNREAFLRINVARNSKVPSLNDLFWNPGGNPDLKDEYCSSLEVETVYDGRLSSTVSFETGVSLYSNFIRDMIQWLPGEFNYWTPQNLNSVNTYGFEADLKVNYREGRLKTMLAGHYSFTRAEEAGTDRTKAGGEQLIYVPVSQFNTNARIEWSSIYLVWLSAFTGKRFTSVDNSDYLPAYLLNNINCGFRFNAAKTSFDLSIRVENIFNTIYQTIAYQPMPMRSYNLCFTFNLRK